MERRERPGRFNKPTEMRYRLGETIAGKSLTLAGQYREGQGKVDELVVFIHGLGCNKDSFKEVWNRNDFKPFSILIPDMAGFGDSSKPDGWSYSIEDHVASIAQLLKNPRYDGKKVNLVGHSMGGSVGLLLAEKIPNVSRFISIEGTLVAEDRGVKSERATETTYDEFIDNVFDDMKQVLAATDNKSLQLWRQWIERARPEAFYKTALSLYGLSKTRKLVDAYNALQCDKYYLYGARTQKMSAIGLIEDQSTVIRIPDAGHFIFNDNPDDSFSTVAEILNSPKI